MIILKKLKFSNMFSYGVNNVIDLQDNTVTQLVGSNGAGKSAIPCILEELLFNKNSRGVKKGDILNRNIEDDYYSCSLEFSVGNDEYVIDKLVKSTTKVVLTKNEEDISGHTTTQTYKDLEQLLDLDFQTFTKLVYQSMNSALDFLKATDANRKKFLVKLLNLDKYLEIHESLKESYKIINEEHIKSDTIVNELTRATNVPDMELVEVPEPTHFDESSRLEELSDLKHKLSINNSEVANYNKYLAAKKAYDLHLANKPTYYGTDHSDEIAKLSEELSDLKAKISHNNKEKAKLSKIQTHCPTCKQELPDSEPMDERIAEIVEETTALIQEADILEEQLSGLKELQRQKSKFDSWENKTVEDPDPVDKPGGLKDVQDSIDNITRELESEKRLSLARDKEILEAEKHNSRVEQFMETKRANLEKLAKARDELKLHNEDKTNVKELVEAFSPKGLVQYKIESEIKVFEQLINEYLSILSGGKFALTFSMDESKLSLSLFDDGSPISITSVSSGEFNKINTATLLAVRSLMQSVSKNNINVLFLDEVISVLDEEAKVTLIELLLEQENMNSIIVSHGFEYPLANTIRVNKENGISFI